MQSFKSRLSSRKEQPASAAAMTPRRSVAEGPGVLQALVGALQNPSPLVVGAALATLNNLLLVRWIATLTLNPNPTLILTPT